MFSINTSHIIHIHNKRTEIQIKVEYVMMMSKLIRDLLIKETSNANFRPLEIKKDFILKDYAGNVLQSINRKKLHQVQI